MPARTWRAASAARSRRTSSCGRSSCCWSPPGVAELGQLERDPLDGAGQLDQLRHQRIAQPPRLGGRIAQRDRPPPRAAVAQPRGQRQRSHRPRAAARAAQQPLDQHRHRLAQRHLVADRLGEPDRLAQRLGRRPRADVRLVLAARQPPRRDPASAEAVGDGGQRQRRQLARRADAQRDHLVRRHRLQAEPVDGQPGEELRRARLADQQRPTGPRPAGGDAGGEAAGGRAHPAAAGQRLRHRLQQPPRPAVQSHEAVAREQRRARLDRLDRSAQRLQPADERVGRVGHGARIGGRQLEHRGSGRSPRRRAFPACTPKAAAAAFTSPTSGWPPGSGPSATGRSGSGPRSATRSGKRGTRTQTISWWARGIGPPSIGEQVFDDKWMCYETRSVICGSATPGL